MNGIMNANVIVNEFEINRPRIQKIDSRIDDCLRDCDNKYFHTFDPICVYDIKLTNITNNEKINSTISDKSMGFLIE